MVVEAVSTAAVLKAAASAATSAVGTLAAGQNQAAALKQQAAFARQQAEFQRQSAILQERQKRRQNSALAAAQRAQFAASGADPSAGSALLAQEDLVGQSALDELTTRAFGIARAQGLEQEAIQDRFRARSAQTKAFFGAGTRLLDTARILDDL